MKPKFGDEKLINKNKFWLYVQRQKDRKKKRLPYDKEVVAASKNGIEEIFAYECTGCSINWPSSKGTVCPICMNPGEPMFF